MGNRVKTDPTRKTVTTRYHYNNMLASSVFGKKPLSRSRLSRLLGGVL